MERAQASGDDDALLIHGAIWRELWAICFADAMERRS
jgi:hypothetical protein